MGFGEDDGWTEADVKKLLVLLGGDVDEVTEMLSDEPDKARKTLEQPLPNHQQQPSTAAASTADEATSASAAAAAASTTSRARAAATLEVASGHRKVVCGSARALARLSNLNSTVDKDADGAETPSAATSASGGGGGGSKSPTAAAAKKKKKKKKKLTKAEIEVEQRLAERKAVLAADEHVVRFVATTPDARPTVVVAGGALPLPLPLPARGGGGGGGGVWRFDVRLRRNLRRQEWVAAGWCRSSTAGCFDWSQDVTVGRRPTQSCGIYLHGSGRIVFRSSDAVIVVDADANAADAGGGEKRDVGDAAQPTPTSTTQTPRSASGVYSNTYFVVVVSVPLAAVSGGGGVLLFAWSAVVVPSDECT